MEKDERRFLPIELQPLGIERDAKKEAKAVRDLNPPRHWIERFTFLVLAQLLEWLKPLNDLFGPRQPQIVARQDPILPFVGPLAQTLDLWNGTRPDTENGQENVSETTNGLAYELDRIDQGDDSELFRKADEAREELSRLLYDLSWILDISGPLGTTNRYALEGTKYNLDDYIKAAGLLLTNMREIETDVSTRRNELSTLQNKQIKTALNLE